MTSLDSIVRDVLELDPDIDLAHVAYRETPTWDSVAHLQLLTALEQAYGFSFRPDELMEMTDYTGIRAILDRRLDPQRR
jgi:acyl carrier protein